MCEQVSLCDCVRRDGGRADHRPGCHGTRSWQRETDEMFPEVSAGKNWRKEERKQEEKGRRKKSGEGNKVERMRGKNSEKKGWNKGVQRNNGWRMEWGKRHK